MKNFILISSFICLLGSMVYSIQQQQRSEDHEAAVVNETFAPSSTAIPINADDNASPVTTENVSGGYSGVNEGSSVDAPYDDIIVLPAAPGTDQFSPISVTDFKSADPSAGISLISAPHANNTGTASLTFAMRLPTGRLGIQPDLSVQYNSEGGASWMGIGWNLSVPSISIETRWGAPRYDAALETEMYSFNGDVLAPVNNRDELVARTAEKHFYPRVEGSFNKMIRHGNSPANYWWEVTGKDGIRNFYGGRPGTGVMNGAVLKDDLGNIGYWALTETRDASDNFVRYEYTTVNDAGVDGSSVPGQQLYPSRIYYTGSGTTDGPYQVEFIRDRQLNETKRKDISIDARLGFKMVTADLLRRVNISLNNTLIRSYDYQYQEGAFYKKLLKSISELDNAGTVFYTHQFEYYDDVNVPAQYNPSAGTTQWTIADDGIKGDIKNPIPGFTGEGSALSTSNAVSRSGGVAVTIGSLAGGTWSKKISVGGGFNYGEDNEEGLLSMIDINGDNLADKVFKKGSNLFYRANLGAATHSFGDMRPITGVTDFSTSNSKNIGGGVQVIPPSGFLGYNYTRTTTTTKIYFSDFNGDGLMDIAVGGRVYFNHLNAQGDPDFVTNSGLTPSPIFPGSGIDGSFMEPDTALQAKQERDFPLQDIVRMWEAPFAGTITITAPVQLLTLPQSGVVNAKKDGVRASIQLRDSTRWSTLIDANDHTVKTPTNVTALSVQKGDHIYFRLQSVYNGEEDVVDWDPIIQYATPVVPCSDVQHKVSNYYKASADFILHSRSAAGMGKTGNIVIDGTFQKAITSDSVSLIVTLSRNNVISTLFQRAYGNKELATGNLLLPGSFPVQEADEVHFSIVSKSYIDRSALQWTPHFAYISFADATPVTSADGNPTMQGYPVPDNSNFNQWVIAVPPAAVANQDTVILWPKITSNSGLSGTLWFTIKGNDSIYARRHIFITNGNMDTLMDSIRLVRRPGELLFMEYATDTLSFAQSLQPLVEIYRDSIFTVAGIPDTIRLSDTINANLYANPDKEFLGPLFRGWGQFALKGDKGNGPIDQSTLNLDELNGYPSDPGNFTDTSQLGGVQDPSKTNFIMLFPDTQKQWWVGYDTSVFIMSNIMSSSRLWVHDVSVDSLMAGGSAGAVYKISTTETNSFSAGITPGLSGSAGTSFAKTVVDLDMMDMNGDRYPDVLNSDQIQYTLPHGGLGTTVITQPVGETNSDGWSAGISLGGNFLEASTENTTKKGSVAAQKTAKNSSGLSGSINTNNDEAGCSWIDMNGDGLIDRIYKDGIVSLNMGYRFAPGEQWNTGGIDRSESWSAGAGLGVNIDAGSFEAGFGLSRTVANNSFNLNDVNGDGLPDQCSMSGSDLVVRLNTGSGFGPSFTWKTFNSITTNVSTGESINAAFTIPIIIPIPFFPLKICINPSVNIGHGVSRQQDVIMDVDGDGYADMLHSDNDGQLSASASTIGRTNLLAKVKGPIGGYFTMDYQRVGNTYEMPQSKWVLKNVEIFDGAAGDGVDTMRQQFSYEGGYQNRYEREFYGFSKVITKDLNTAAGNIVYRSHVSQFLNTSYYDKGLLASQWLEDAQGNKFTQTNYLYELRDVVENVKFPALIQTEKLYYEGATTAGVSTTRRFEYNGLGNVTHISDAGDGSPGDSTRADITYHDIDNLYIKSIPASVTVTTAEGVKRKTVTTINGSGSFIRVRRFLADGATADIDMEYDNYSNLSKIIYPANYKGQRMWYSYEYDNTVHSYITKVTDAFGYSSSGTYDYRFGEIASSLSMNNEPMRYSFDNRGRMTTVNGPYELAAGRPYSVSFSYNTAASIAYAVTRHYDPETNADINTIDFADGLGRNVQEKKQVSLFKGKHLTDEVKMVVSGSDLFDAFGRVERSYYPITEPIGGTFNILNTGSGDFKSSTIYDVVDRPLQKALADGATTNNTYSTVNGFFNTSMMDALNNRKEIQADARGRKRLTKNYGDTIITTLFDYDALNELVKVTDTKGNNLTLTYDNFGRKTSMSHPDAGRTDFVYDPAGNLLKKITAQIRKEIPTLGAIKYQYDYERLTDIDYPRYYQNKVKYTYGASGTGRKAGRLILQEDASGGQEFFYGLQGEIIKTIRTVLITPVFATTYVSEQQYDSWGRTKKVSYPDGEEVNYHYNRSGGLYSMQGSKLGSTYNYVDQLGYNEYEERVYMLYGNGVETKYAYDNLRRHLAGLQATTSTGQDIMKHAYTYDAIGNILSVINNVTAQGGQLGGNVKQQYHYDNLYRLDSASGEYTGSQTASYSLKMAYDNLYNITHKTLGNASGQVYDNGYAYNGTHPHQASQVGQDNYEYNENGNQSGTGVVENYWDEENRLMAVINDGTIGQYTYDADGERVIKSSGGLQAVWLNGAPAGIARHNDNYTVTVSPYITCTRSGYVKHYFADDQRILSKQGHGTFKNISFPTPGLTAGGIDYIKRAAAMEKAMQAYYASQGASPGPPTDKNYWARPENSGIPVPVFVDSTAYNVPPGWPGNTTPPPTGPPIFVDSIPSNDSVKAGYGFNDPGHFYEADQLFYHADQWKNTNYASNRLGVVSQHLEYTASGETFIEEHTGSFQAPYLFNSRQRDEETGYYYYGSLYYHPSLSQWLSIDLSGIEGGEYGLIAGTDNGLNGVSAATAGGANASSVSYGNDAAGMTLSAFATEDDGGDKKSKKPVTPSSTPGMNKGSVSKTQVNNQRMQKRNFRQVGGGALQNSGMFFNHKLPVIRTKTSVIPARRSSVSVVRKSSR